MEFFSEGIGDDVLRHRYCRARRFSIEKKRQGERDGPGAGAIVFYQALAIARILLHPSFR